MSCRRRQQVTGQSPDKRTNFWRQRFMSVSWKEFVDGFRVGSVTGNIEELSALITDDFEWVT